MEDGRTMRRRSNGVRRAPTFALALAVLAGCPEPRSEPAGPPATAVPPRHTLAPESSLPDTEVHVSTPDGWVQIQTARPSPGPEFDRLSREAGQAYESGDYATALARADAALAMDPEAQGPRSTAALTACKLHDERLANAHARFLRGMWRPAVGDVCIRSGVRLEGWEPMPDSANP